MKLIMLTDLISSVYLKACLNVFTFEYIVWLPCRGRRRACRYQKGNQHPSTDNTMAKKDYRTNNGLQNMHIKLKIE
jgi:hypothetical protein